jgi:hypothetical protein
MFFTFKTNTIVKEVIMISADEERERLFRFLKEKMTPEDFDKLQKNVQELEVYEKVMREAENFNIELTTPEKDVIREALVKMCLLFESGKLNNPRWHGVFQNLQMEFPLPVMGGESAKNVAIYEWRQVVVALRSMLQLEYSEIEKMKFRDLAKKISDSLPKTDK